MIQEHDLSHITAQQSHHVWRAPRKTQVTSRRWSHITDIIFWQNSLRASMNPANRIVIFFSIRIKKSLRARSPYAIFNWNVCIIHSRLHWGAGLGRSVVYASIIAIYIGALVLTGWQPMHQSWPFTLIVQCFYWLCHCCPAFFHRFSGDGPLVATCDLFSAPTWFNDQRGTKPCGFCSENQQSYERSILLRLGRKQCFILKAPMKMRLQHEDAT